MGVTWLRLSVMGSIGRSESDVQRPASTRTSNARTALLPDHSADPTGPFFGGTLLNAFRRGLILGIVRRAAVILKADQRGIEVDRI